MDEQQIYTGLSFTAQLLFAISAIPFWWKFKQSYNKFGVFEWTWFIAEVMMIVGSIGLGRFDLVPGLLINIVFLSLCLWHSATYRPDIKDIMNALNGMGMEVHTPESYFEKLKKKDRDDKGDLH